MDGPSVYGGKFGRPSANGSAILGPHRKYSQIRSTSQSRSRIRGSQIFKIVCLWRVFSLANRARSRRSREENPSLNDSAGRLPPETLRWAETTSAIARVVSPTKRREHSRRELLPCLAALSPPRVECTCVLCACTSCVHSYVSLHN